MVIVVVIIAIMAGLAIPVLDSMLNPNQVLASVDMVRSELLQARSWALEQGRPYRFSVQDGGGNFKTEPDDAVVGEDGFIREGELPEPCFFTATVDGDPPVLGSPGGGSDYRAVVVFLPNGTARDDAALSFGREGLLPATLRVRALTGAISQDKRGNSP